MLLLISQKPAISHQQRCQYPGPKISGVILMPSTSIRSYPKTLNAGQNFPHRMCLYAYFPCYPAGYHACYASTVCSQSSHPPALAQCNTSNTSHAFNCSHYKVHCPSVHHLTAPELYLLSVTWPVACVFAALVAATRFCKPAIKPAKKAWSSAWRAADSPMRF